MGRGEGTLSANRENTTPVHVCQVEISQMYVLVIFATVFTCTSTQPSRTESRSSFPTVNKSQFAIATAAQGYGMSDRSVTSSSTSDSDVGRKMAALISL